MQAGDGHQEMTTGLMTVRGHEEDDDVDDDDDAGFNREEAEAAAILLSLPMAGGEDFLRTLLDFQADPGKVKSRGDCKQPDLTMSRSLPSKARMERNGPPNRYSTSCLVRLVQDFEIW
ncbi:hypothetical protein AK812_SmicGene32579 [Symbiodinium microadriaticum]|uniref:Uncharacterized protein n=1 Tax=Symbiodinium microadriaticum TaxID=2951 RepID=A0A1Q9CTS8_SYMMI|nr:hypothetical protein AK812_SmicGene32579 [Symbiodinium microadriaticum]